MIWVLQGMISLIPIFKKKLALEKWLAYIRDILWTSTA